MRKERIGLEHHAHVAVGRREARDILAADGDEAFRRHFEPGDQAKRRCLAAT